MIFSSSSWSNKHGECERLAQQVAAGAKAMGLIADVVESRLSASRYVLISDSEYDKQIKVRCSDHADKVRNSDIHAWAGECPSEAITVVAGLFGRAVPAKFTPEAYEARSKAASIAADARRVAKISREHEIEANIIAALRDAKKTSALAASAFLKDGYPNMPAATRSRIAALASYHLKKEQECARASGDPEKLAALAVKDKQAMHMLFDLVGEERFNSMRPKGFPRILWTVPGQPEEDVQAPSP